MRRSQTSLARRRDYLWDVLTGKDTVKELRTMQTENYIKDKWTKARDEVLEQDFAFDMKSTNVFLFCDLFRLFGFADRIIVMREGCVVGNGTHEELLGNNSEYQRIWGEQAKWYSTI